MAKLALYRIVRLTVVGNDIFGYDIEKAFPTNNFVTIDFEDDDQIFEALQPFGLLTHELEDICIEGDWEALTLSDEMTGEPLLQLTFSEGV